MANIKYGPYYMEVLVFLIQKSFEVGVTMALIVELK